MSEKNTITVLGGQNSLIQKLEKNRNSEYIMKLFSERRIFFVSNVQISHFLGDPGAESAHAECLF